MDKKAIPMVLLILGLFLGAIIQLFNLSFGNFVWIVPALIAIGGGWILFEHFKK